METRTRIKICGITNAEDAFAAIAYGADALGFIFVPESPRYIGKNETVRDLLERIPPFITRVAVSATIDSVPATWLPHIDVLQIYAYTGAEAPAGKRIVQAFRVRDAASLEEIAQALKPPVPHAMHLDTFHKDKLGGSGETFNWQLAIQAKARFRLPLILAGGLTPQNVQSAVREVRPYAVDVASGVEAEPGRKDHAALRAFITAVRTADSR